METHQYPTQREAAQKIGINYKLLNHYYLGRKNPKWPMAKRIAEALDLDPIEVVEDCPAALHKVFGKRQAA